MKQLFLPLPVVCFAAVAFADVKDNTLAWGYEHTPEGTRITWELTDWVGISLVIIVLVFACIALLDVLRGNSAIRVLGKMTDLARALLRVKVN
jgi:hypothetical protein